MCYFTTEIRILVHGGYVRRIPGASEMCSCMHAAKCEQWNIHASRDVFSMCVCWRVAWVSVCVNSLHFIPLFRANGAPGSSYICSERNSALLGIYEYIYIVSGERTMRRLIQVRSSEERDEIRRIPARNMVHTSSLYYISFASEMRSPYSYHIDINKIPFRIWSAKFYASFSILHSNASDRRTWYKHFTAHLVSVTRSWVHSFAKSWNVFTCF